MRLNDTYLIEISCIELYNPASKQSNSCKNIPNIESMINARHSHPSEDSSRDKDDKVDTICDQSTIKFT